MSSLELLFLIYCSKSFWGFIGFAGGFGFRVDGFWIKGVLGLGLGEMDNWMVLRSFCFCYLEFLIFGALV